MRLLIDCTYFCKGERFIQNAPTTIDTEDQNEIAVKDTIEGYVETLQDEFLCSMLGDSAAAILQSYLDQKAEVDARNAKLEDGEEPEVFETDAELEFLADGLKESFADYVFYKMLRSVNTLVTTTGVVELKSANRYRTPADRQASIWNRMVGRNMKFVEAAKNALANYTIYYSANLVTPINPHNL